MGPAPFSSYDFYFNSARKPIICPFWYSKESLACWLVSAKGQAIAAPSQKHREWMREFWAGEQNSVMESNSMTLTYYFDQKRPR